MGTDLFFNMPLHQNPVIYTYMAISVQIHLKHSKGSLNLDCDWMGVLSQHLNQGWRLSDIYMDDLEMASSHYTSYSRKNFVGLNSVWFFEKEISKLEDSTALYCSV